MARGGISTCTKALIGLLLSSACQASESHYNIILQRRDPAVTLLGELLHFGSGIAAIASPIAALQRTFLGKYVPLEVFRVNMTALTPSELCHYLTQLNPGIAFCESDGPVALDAPSATPDDPDYTYQYDMKNIGMPAAWATGQFGSPQVKVCIIDTGLDYKHPDLAANVWMNPVEMAGPGATAANGWQNGIDDDGDGVVDDIYGANFNTEPPNGDVLDQHGHGTHVAGVIGAVGNNDVGITGVNQAATLMPCRFMNAEGNGSREQAIKCMDWCLTKGAHVLSNSWGEVPDSNSLQVVKLMPCRFMDSHGNGNISNAIKCMDWCMHHGAHAMSNSYGVYNTPIGLTMQAAVSAVAAQGAVFISSAGNDANNNDASAHWPSNIETATTISVAALDRTGALWARSNYGNTTVDIAAPGENIFSTYIGTGNYQYTQLSGTSVAVPHVTGTAALMLAQLLQNGFNISTQAPNVGLGATVKKLIMATATPMGGSYTVSGSLNTPAALAKAAGMLPGALTVAGTASDATTEAQGASPSPAPLINSIITAAMSILPGNTPDGPAHLDSGAGSSSPTGQASTADSKAAAPSSLAAALSGVAQSMADRVTGGRRLRGVRGELVLNDGMQELEAMRATSRRHR